MKISIAHHPSIAYDEIASDRQLVTVTNCAVARGAPISISDEIGRMLTNKMSKSFIA